MSLQSAPVGPSPGKARKAQVQKTQAKAEGAHFQHQVRVYWEDTDAGGIVFYGNYLKFMERARTEWLSSLGFGQEDMRHSGEGMFIVADTQMRFIRPARLDDRLTITVNVRERGRATVAFSQDVWCGDTLLTEGQVRIGWVQYRAGSDGERILKPGRIPERILAVLPTPLSDSTDSRPVPEVETT